ncbi:MAG TPA: pyridoxal phosphate-dependent aminotransferase [Acidimicrobiales bacterium]
MPGRSVHVSSRSNVPPFHAMAMASLATAREAAGMSVVHLEVGQPSSPAPAGVRAAAARALERDQVGYTNAPGLLSLRTAIAGHYQDWYGVERDPGQIVVTAGASAGFTLAFLACFDPGDRVGIIEPGYPCYRNVLLALGVEPVPVAVGPETRWVPTPDLLEAIAPLDGLVVASPSNPTGTVLSRERLAALSDWCAEHGVQLISDEIYHGITYGERAESALAISPDAVVVSSFSKYFSMTGWRLGWITAPPELMAAVERFQQNLYICAPTLSQLAAVAAFGCSDELDAHVARYAQNRRLLLDGLAAAGLKDRAAADGAFYVYADVSRLTDDSNALCRRWLEDAGVATTPGIDFDLERGRRYVRFSYSASGDAIVEACRRLAAWVEVNG